IGSGAFLPDMSSSLRIAIADSLPNDITWNRHKIAFEPPQQVWMGEAAVADYIMESRKKLVKENILDKSMLEKSPDQHAAYARNGYDWRYMSLASVMP
ncbi:MAG: asparagine synthase-related protein, partial [Flavitalea sp.]